MPDEDAVVQRIDFMRLDAADRKTTPQGGLVVKARIARTGILTYRNADGTERRELRLPEDVLTEDTLASFRHAPVTELHHGLITPLNWRRHTVGHATGEVGREQEDGVEYATTHLHIQDAGAIANTESGKNTELSCGYQCRYDARPGTHPIYGKFDGRQYGVIGNHIAMGPAGWGRSGAKVALRMDGDDTLAVSGLPEGSSYVRGMPDEKTKTADEKSPVTHTDAADLRGQNAALKAENERLRKEAKDREDAAAEDATQKRIDEGVKAKVALVALATPILGAAWRHDGKSDDAIRREVLAKLEPTVLELPEAHADAEDAEAFVSGAFRAAVTRADAVARANANSAKASPRGALARPNLRAVGGGGGRSDAGADPSSQDPETRTIQDETDALVDRQKIAWKGKRADKASGGRGRR